MNSVTFLWSTTAAASLMLAFVCAILWAADRRDVAKLMFCLAALSTAAATPFELAMMQATTVESFGAALRWYHLPIFFDFVGQLLFVHFYLGTGRRWLFWSFMLVRVGILIANFSIEPNFNFREIARLDSMPFLGEQVAVVGQGVPYPWQWIAVGSMVMLVVYVLDAAYQAWRLDFGDSRRRGLMVGLAIGVPMVCNLGLNQLVVFGLVHVPICATLWFLGTLSVITYELTRELIVNSRARVQLAELRNQWAQVERVNALGQLASSLAHELAQPLSATQFNASTARILLQKPNPDLREINAICDDIDKESMRAAEIIQRMRSLIQHRKVESKPLAITDVVEDVLRLLRHEAIARCVFLKAEVKQELPVISGDRVHIAQVLMNLLINAMDAVRERSPQDRHVRVEARIDTASNVQLSVHDSGPGIPADRLEQIFSSLYTTKASGLGVGLSLSRMIIEAHGGNLWAENSESGGAIFRFTLPRTNSVAGLAGTS